MPYHLRFFDEAARFAASVLASAPRTGVSLISKKILSRRTI